MTEMTSCTIDQRRAASLMQSRVRGPNSGQISLSSSRLWISHSNISTHIMFTASESPETQTSSINLAERRKNLSRFRPEVLL